MSEAMIYLIICGFAGAIWAATVVTIILILARMPRK